MARKFLTPIDLSKLEIQNVAAQTVASFPSTPATGQFVFRTDLKKFFVYTGDTGLDSVSGWVAADGSNIPDSIITSAKILDGTIVDGDISATAGIVATKLDTATFDTKVQANRLDQLSAPTASVNLNSQKITALADPTNDTDAANKRYVDAAVVGIDWKASVKVATTADITLSGTQTIDGIALGAGDRVLVKNQTNKTENGIYTVAAGAWSRSTDADTAAEVTSGFAVFVEQGTVNADSGWVLTTDTTVVLGTTELDFTQFTGLGQIVAGDGLTKSGNTLNVVGTSDRITVAADSVDIATTYVGQNTITTLGTITTGVWNGTDVAVADGGTGSSTKSGARTNLSDTAFALPQKYAADIGGATTIAVTHGLGTTDVVVSAYLSSAQVECDVTVTDTNTVTLGFAAAPAAGAIRVVVVG
jgi:hypothetical protein